MPSVSGRLVYKRTCMTRSASSRVWSTISFGMESPALQTATSITPKSSSMRWRAALSALALLTSAEMTCTVPPGKATCTLTMLGTPSYSHECSGHRTGTHCQTRSFCRSHHKHGELSTRTGRDLERDARRRGRTSSTLRALCSLPRLLASSVTEAPSLRNWWASARPMPSDPPVIRTCLFVNEILMATINGRLQEKCNAL